MRTGRRGFTIVEILITLALLSIMLVIIYEVMGRMFFSGTITQWESTLTTDFSNADSRIRDFLNASSYPSLLTPQGNAVASYNPPESNNTGFLLGFPGSPPSVDFDDMSSRKEILQWYRCEDGRQGIEGLENKPPRAVQITLATVPKGKTKQKNINIADLVMEEKPVTNLPNDFTAFTTLGAAAVGAVSGTTRMVSDVRSIKVTLFSRTGAVALPTKDRVQVEVEIKCIEPVQGNAERSRKITAEANVGAKQLGS